MSDATLSQRLSDLLALVEAWKHDDDRLEPYQRSESKPSALVPLLWAQLEGWVAEVDGRAGLPEEERKALAGVFDQRLGGVNRSGNSTWRLRNALDSLRRAVTPTPPTPLQEQIWVALMRANCWPKLATVRGQAPENLTPYGAYANEINKATEGNRDAVLRFLLDWPNSGPASQTLLYPRETGTGLAGDFHVSQATGWAWAVRNMSQACLDVWLAAGADPNAHDKAGRPVLAYACRPDQVRALLAAGADPLAPALPWAVRRAHLNALWEGWSNPRTWDSREKPAEQKWTIAWDYLRERTAAWPKEEVHAASDVVAFHAYNRGVNDKGVHAGEAWSRALALQVSRREALRDDDEVLVGARRWSFAGAAALERLLAPPASMPPPPLPKTARLLEPGLPEAAFRLLATLPASPSSVKVLKRLGPQVTAAALRVALETLTQRGRSLDRAALSRCLATVLHHTQGLGPTWDSAMTAVVDGVFDTVCARWPGSVGKPIVSERDTILPLRWWQQHPDTPALATQVRWAVMGLEVYRDKADAPAPMHAWARQRLLELNQSHDLLALLNPDDAAVFQRLTLRDPGLGAALNAGQAASRLEERLGAQPTVRAAKPRM